MKKLILGILTSSLLTSCIGTKKFSAFVAPKFQEEQSTYSNDDIIFDLTGLETKSDSITSTKVKSLFIPALLYWEWNNSLKCEISPNIVGQVFQRNFHQFSSIFNIQEFLQGKKLEIKVENIPNSFSYTYKGNTIILIFAYSISELEAIFPLEQDLTINYKLTQNGSILKEGRLTVKNTDKPIQNVSKSTKKFIWYYIDQFKENNKNMTKELVEKLLAEL